MRAQAFIFFSCSRTLWILISCSALWYCYVIYRRLCLYACSHRVIILNRGSMFAFQWREFCIWEEFVGSAYKLLPLTKERQETPQFPGTQNTYFTLSAPLPTRAISQWARSLEWRHAVTLHILVGKICITFFSFSSEASSLYLVFWLCACSL